MPVATTHELRLVRRQIFWCVLMVFISLAALALGLGLYANKAASDTGKDFCAMLLTLDGAYQAQPPKTPAGKVFATDIHQLTIQLGCITTKGAAK